MTLPNVDTSPRGRWAKPAGIFWRVIESAMIVAFLSMLAVMFVQVVSRYVFGIGVPWTNETSRFLFIAEIFLGAAIVQRYGAQISVTVVLDILPRQVRRWFEIVSNVLTVAIAGAVVVGTLQMAGQTANVTASTIPISFSYLYLLQGFGILLLVLLLIRDLWAAFSSRNQEPAQ